MGEVDKNCINIYIYSPYRCKVEQPDALQHNGMTNSEMEMCIWKYGVLF